MNPSFNILTDQSFEGPSKLVMQIGQQNVSFVVINDKSECTALTSYHYPADTDPAVADRILTDIIAQHPILEEAFQQTNIIYSYPSAVLVPEKWYDPTKKEELLQLQYGENRESVTRSEANIRNSFLNVFRVPKSIDRITSNIFSTAVYGHLYTLFPASSQENGGQILIIFGTNDFTTIVKKENDLLLAQQYAYKTPEDVAYYLLNICERFDLSVQEVQLHLYGMIDVQSNLYKELYKYFMHLAFASLPEQFTYPEAIKALPGHYFSHLFFLASCV